MKGKIRTLEKCPKCGDPFKNEPLICANCFTHPKRYFIDLHHKGRIKLYSDKLGRPLASWESADRVLNRIRSEIDDHTFDPTRYAKADLEKFLFRNQIEDWYLSKLAEVKKGNRAKSYTRGLKRFKNMYYLPHFEKMDVREIRVLHIREFYEGLPDHLSLKYIKNIMDALKGFFNTLVLYDLIEKKPAFPVITIDRKTPEWIDRETQLAMLDKIREDYRSIFIFLSFQGVRPGEGRALKVKDIDFNNGCFTISRTFSDREIRERVKSKVSRPRALNPELVPMLKELCKDKHPEAFVFINPKTGRPFSADILYDRWNEVRKETGLDIAIYNATRHSFASNLLKDGADIMAISKLLGHTDLKMTQIYTDVDLDTQKTAFKKQGKVTALRPQTVRSKKN